MAMAASASTAAAPRNARSGASLAVALPCRGACAAGGASSLTAAGDARVAFVRAVAAAVGAAAVGAGARKAHAGRRRRRPSARSRGRIALSVSGELEVAPATGADLRPAAELSVRSLRWTKNWLDSPSFTERDYELLASNELQAYSRIYFRKGVPESVLLVAKAQEEVEDAKAPAEASPFGGLFGSSGSSGPRSRTKIIGCVGCEVKCFSRLTGEIVEQSEALNGDDKVLRPVMADLAVAPASRGRGAARALIGRLEELVRGWGYEELVLLVEATNFPARNLYARLGYRLSAIKPNIETSYLDTSNGPGRLAQRRTLALLLRKSLKPFPLGAFENTNWGLYLPLLTVAYVAWDAVQSGQFQLSALVDSLKVDV